MPGGKATPNPWIDALIVGCEVAARGCLTCCCGDCLRSLVEPRARLAIVRVRLRRGCSCVQKTIGRVFARPFSQGRAMSRWFWIEAIRGRSIRSSLIARSCARRDEAVGLRLPYCLSKRERFVSESALRSRNGTPRLLYGRFGVDRRTASHGRFKLGLHSERYKLTSTEALHRAGGGACLDDWGAPPHCREVFAGRSSSRAHLDRVT